MNVGSEYSDSESSEEDTACKQLLVTKNGIRKLYYRLLTDQIPVSKVDSVIRTVLSCFEPDVDVTHA